ncbi:MAG: hypothetical protein ACU843_11525, partial [Gammaproteobacteria bacterium]
MTYVSCSLSRKSNERIRNRKESRYFLYSGWIALTLIPMVFWAPQLLSQQLNITVTTLPATGITDTGATLNGTVNGNGEDISAVYFDYGLMTAPYDQVFVNAVPFNVPAAMGQTAVSLQIGGLTCGTVYHFRVTADDQNGRNAQGNDLTFTTVACAGMANSTAIPGSSVWSLTLLGGLMT